MIPAGPAASQGLTRAIHCAVGDCPRELLRRGHQSWSDPWVHSPRHTGLGASALSLANQQEVSKPLRRLRNARTKTQGAERCRPAAGLQQSAPSDSPAAVEEFYHRRRFYTARVRFGGWAAHRNDRRGMTTGRWWRCSSFNGSARVGAQRLDKTGLGGRQQLREHLEVVPPSGREGQRCIHVDADHVAARRGAQLARQASRMSQAWRPSSGSPDCRHARACVRQ